MAKYECSVCGFIYNEASASLKFHELDACPICGADKDGFKLLEEEDTTSSGSRVVKLDEIGDIEPGEQANPFVIEKRQEFWSKADDVEVEKDPNIETYYNDNSSVISQEEYDKRIQEEKEKAEKATLPYGAGMGAIQRVLGSEGDSDINVEAKDSLNSGFDPSMVQTGNGDQSPPRNEVRDNQVVEDKVEDEITPEEVATPEEPVVEEEAAPEAEPAAENNPAPEPEAETESFFDDTVVDENGTEDDVSYAFKDLTAVDDAEEELGSFEEVNVDAEESFFEEVVVNGDMNTEEMHSEILPEDKDGLEEADTFENSSDSIIGEEVFFNEDDEAQSFVFKDINEVEVPEVKEEPVQEESVQEEPVQEETVQEESIQEEAEAVAEEPAKEDMPEETAEIDQTKVEPYQAMQILIEDETAAEEEKISQEDVVSIADVPVDEAEPEIDLQETEPEIEDEIEEEEEESLEIDESIFEIAEAEVLAAEAEDNLEEEELEYIDIPELDEETVEEEIIQDEKIAEELEVPATRAAAPIIVINNPDEEDKAVTSDDIEEELPANTDDSDIAYSMLKADMRYDVRYDDNVNELCKQYSVDGDVSNGLENIIILPAQLNPMPLPADADVDIRSVLGQFTDCPIEVPQPFGFTKLFLWGEMIPGREYSKADYEDKALILIKGEDGHIPYTESRKEIKDMVDRARNISEGTPVGIDLIAGRIERDLETAVYAGMDYVIINDVSGVILPYILRRAKNYLNKINSHLEIYVCVNALKDARELAKLIALGADFVFVERGFSLEAVKSIGRELKDIARSTGHDDIYDINMLDICTVDMDIATYTDIAHI